MNRLIARASATAIFVMVVGCGQTDGAPTADGGAGVNRPTASSDANTSSSPATSAAESTISKFGQAFTFRNGLSVSVGLPEPYTPSPTASTSSIDSQYVAFTVNVVNGSSDIYEPASFTANLQSGNTEAQEVFDSANGYSGSPSTSVLPGRESQFGIAFEVADPTDLVLELSPGFEYRDAIFTN